MLAFSEVGFFNEIPYPVAHIDTGFQPREVYEFVDELRDRWDFELIRFKNEQPFDDVIEGGIPNLNPHDYDTQVCCEGLKSEALAKLIEEYDFDAVIVAIRHDEQVHRQKEYYFSSRIRPSEHTRVHPMLHRYEWEVWKATKEFDLPVNPLYLEVKDGKRYTSLGCIPCTSRVPTQCSEGEITLDEIISEVKEHGTFDERAGRA